MSELVKALRHTCDGCNPTPCCEFEALGPEAADLIESQATEIDRLTAELTDYRALAADYGIDGKMMLTLAKSQIETAKENAKLTEQLAAAVEDLKFVFEQKRRYADSKVLDGVDCICPLCACWLGDGAKSCDGDCNNAQWRGEESE